MLGLIYVVLEAKKIVQRTTTYQSRKKLYPNMGINKSNVGVSKSKNNSQTGSMTCLVKPKVNTKLSKITRILY